MSKFEIASISVLKDVNVALWGMKNVDLTKETINILGVHISHDKKLQDDLNVRHSIKNIVNVIILWGMKKLTLEGKLTIFKSLPISKIAYFINYNPKFCNWRTETNPEKFLYGDKESKIKHDRLCTKYKDVGLKSQSSQFKILLDKKVIQLKFSWTEINSIPYIKKYVGKESKFHSNIKIPNNILGIKMIKYLNLGNEPFWNAHFSFKRTLSTAHE